MSTGFQKLCTRLQQAETSLQEHFPRIYGTLNSQETQAVTSDNNESGDVLVKFEQVSSIFSILSEIKPELEKLKIKADEKDPEKKIYGEKMVEKVLSTWKRFVDVWDVTKAEKEKLESKAKEVQERLAREKQEQLKKQEEERKKKEEEEAKKREAEKREQEEKEEKERKQKEEERKKKEEEDKRLQEEIKRKQEEQKLEEERREQEKKQKEEEEQKKKLAEEEAKRQQQAKLVTPATPKSASTSTTPAPTVAPAPVPATPTPTTTATTATTSAPSTTSPSAISNEFSLQNMTTNLQKGLLKLRQSCPNFDQFTEAVRVLLVFIGNVLDDPSQDKFRKISLKNPKFLQKLGSFAGGIECLNAVGFVHDNSAEAHLIMKQIPADLHTIKSQIEAAHPSLKTKPKAAATTSAPPSSTPLSPPSSSPSPSAAFPSSGGVNPLLQQVMGNPEALQAAMSLLQNNPSAMQQAASMLQGGAGGGVGGGGFGGGNNPLGNISSMMTPEMMQTAMQMMQSNPAGFQSALQSALSNPELMSTMNSMMGYDVSSMMQNPMVQSMLSNPQLMSSLMGNMNLNTPNTNTNMNMPWMTGLGGAGAGAGAPAFAPQSFVPPSQPSPSTGASPNNPVDLSQLSEEQLIELAIQKSLQEQNEQNKGGK